jgi:hypothetical protein
LAADPWTAYGEEMMTMTGEWAEYYLEFTPDVDADPASLTLHIQSDDEDFWIDDSRWYTGAYAPPVVSAIDAQGKVATTWGSLKSR